MKNFKLILLSTFITIGVFSVVLISSCKKKPTCDGVVCINGGTCADGTCSCPPGYEGSRCETKKVADFSGQYIGGDICPVLGNQNYTLTIGQSGANAFPLIGLGGPFSNLNTVNSTGSYNKLTIPSQVQGSYTVSGTGTLTGNTIVIEYTISDFTDTYSCTFTGTK